MTTQSKQIIHTYCGRASSNRLPPFSQKTNNPAKSGVLSLILNALESRPKNRKRMRWNVQYFKLKMCSQCYKTSFCGKIIKKSSRKYQQTSVTFKIKDDVNVNAKVSPHEGYYDSCSIFLVIWARGLPQTIPNLSFKL